jgi:pimeloyl-ACP methyl ester carboxylesterase
METLLPIPALAGTPIATSAHQNHRMNPCRSKQSCALIATGAGLSLLLAGCTTPIGADRVTTQQSYAQVNASALSTGKPGAETVSILHRFGLDRLAERQPEEAVRQLHQKAVATGERSLLFALAETSYAAGENIRRSMKSWESRDARDYYLGAAMYAWLFLYGEGKDTPPGALDRRYREACDLYNYGLGLALAEAKDTHGAVQLQNGRRRLPVGEIEVQLDSIRLTSQPLDTFDQFLLADRFRVRGLSVRNRDSGIGTPLICVPRAGPKLKLGVSVPATALLRGPASLTELASGKSICPLELYPGLVDSTVTIGTSQLPLESDLTTYRAYNLNQSTIWKLGKLDFLAPAEHIPNQLILHEPFDPKRVPVVFVHGTFSSPVTWAEMANTLIADPVLRDRYQVWSFIYGSGNPLVKSIADLRTALTEQVAKVDPDGTNQVLRQMVVLGHSQGGLLTKGTAVDNGDLLWRMVSTNRFEDVQLADPERAEIQRLIFYKPLPFVSRVVFISTPHRGSYLSGGLARRIGRRIVSLPGDLVSSGKSFFSFSAGSEAEEFLKGKMPTSLDGMSPKNPALLAMAEIPVAPGIKSHSIIPVLKEENLAEAKDGVVAYSSAHVTYVESEFVLKDKHSCLGNPAAIEEVRRILHLHLDQLH